MLAAPWLTQRFGFGGFVALYAVAAVAWLPLRRARVRQTTALIIGIALRIVFLFASPQLSGDAWRYMFDGRTLAHGANPYRVLPTDPRVNHPEIPTIYPPHAEIAFAVVHRLPLWRLLLIACDVLAMLLLRERAIVYATFPPLLFEGAWSAHVEIAAALLLLVAWRFDSGAAGAGAVGMKVIPIAALPALLIHSNRRGRFAAVFALVLLLPVIPFVISGPLMPGMRDYATRWIFNSPAYDAAFFIADRVDVKRAFTAIKDPLHLEPIAPFVYAHVYSDFLARALLACVALALIARWQRDPVASIGSLLLCSPAIHPWYWMALVPLAIDLDRRVWLWLALCAPASYLLYAGASRWVVYALAYGLPALIARLPRAGLAS